MIKLQCSTPQRRPTQYSKLSSLQAVWNARTRVLSETVSVPTYEIKLEMQLCHSCKGEHSLAKVLETSGCRTLTQNKQ